MNTFYGNGNPPFTLYQSEIGLWGLVDQDGEKLPAVFQSEDDKFWREPNEILSFDSEEGFDLLSWFDLDEWG